MLLDNLASGALDRAGNDAEKAFGSPRGRISGSKKNAVWTEQGKGGGNQPSVVFFDSKDPVFFGTRKSGRIEKDDMETALLFL